jgi:putative ABC transport system permease protein
MRRPPGAFNPASVSAINPAVGSGIVVGDIGVVQRLLNRTDLSRLFVQPDQPLQRPALADIAPQLRLKAASQTADVGELTESFHLNLTAFGLLSFAVGIFIVYSTIGLAFEQRRGMVRTLRALGISLPRLITLMFIEVLLLALVGACLGILLGYMVAAMLLPDVAVTLRGLYGADVAGTLQFRASWWVSGMAIALLGSLAAAAVEALADCLDAHSRQCTTPRMGHAIWPDAQRADASGCGSAAICCRSCVVRNRSDGGLLRCWGVS